MTILLNVVCINIIFPGEWEAQNSLGFWETNTLSYPGQKKQTYWWFTKNQKKKLPYSGSFVPVDHRIKIKEIEKRKYLKKLWKLNVTEIRVLNGVLGMNPKGLERSVKEFENRGRIETIQGCVWARRLKVLETWGDFSVTQIPIKGHQVTLVWKKN